LEPATTRPKTAMTLSDDDEDEKYFCHCPGQVGEVVEKKKIAEGDLDKKGEQDKCIHIPGEYALFGVSGRFEHKVRVGWRNPEGQRWKAVGHQVDVRNGRR